MKPFTPLLAVTFSAAQAASLHGAAVLAGDGTFLGTCDGPINFTSVGNTVSLYSSSVGLYSPYNTVTTTAPNLLNLPEDLLRTVTTPVYNPNRAANAALASNLRTLPLLSTRVSVSTFYPNASVPDIFRLRLCWTQNS